MSTTAALATFTGGLLLSIVSGAVLGERIEQLGARLGFTEAFLGILTALGADAPEISSALTALHRGHHDLGFAIVFGSSVFNLAGVLGLSAVVAGNVVIGRGALALSGGVAVALSSTVAAQLLGWLTPAIAAVIISAAFVPYVVLSALTPRQVASLGFPFAVTEAVAEADRAARRAATPRHPTAVDVLTLAPSAVAIVVASVWMVNAASVLGARWGVPQALVGTVVIATLTSVPNVVSAVRLARCGRGSAVVSEAFTSNSLNLIAGVSVPSLMMTMISAGPVAQLAAVWLVAMSIAAIALMSFKRGLTRSDGVALIAIYAAFLGAVIWLSGGS